MSYLKRNIYRTYCPSMNFYASDGMGRDKYITYNNGGFWNKNIPPGTSICKSTIMSPTRYRINTKQRLVPPFKYTCDGTGRDGYVIFNSGGLIRNSESMANCTLKRYLRTPELSTCEYIGNSVKKIFYSKQEKEINQFLKNKTIDVVTRLYTNEKYKFIPKKTRNGRANGTKPYLLKRKMSLPELFPDTITNFNHKHHPPKNDKEQC